MAPPARIEAPILAPSAEPMPRAVAVCCERKGGARGEEKEFVFGEKGGAAGEMKVSRVVAGGVRIRTFHSDCLRKRAAAPVWPCERV